MKLWTPSKPRPRIAKPHLCGRCGRVKPEWLREHRRHAGSVLLLGCCCDTESCTNLTELEITLSGTDASICTQCDETGSDSSIKFTSLAVDGTYTVPFSVQRSYCVFFASFTDTVNPYGTITSYTDTTCSTVDQEFHYVQLDIEIQVSTDSETQCFFVSFKIWIEGATGAETAFVYEGTPITFGDPIPNESTCPNGNPSDGGQATVAVP